MASNKKYKNEYYETRTVTDLKDLINSSAALFGDNPAYLVKQVPGGSYTPKSYNELKEDIDAFGTALIDLGLKGCHVAVIGETRYEWVVADLAMTNGTGVAVPLDKELPVSELENLVQRAHVNAVVFSAGVEKRLLEAVSGLESLQYLISMDAEKSTDQILSMKELIRNGKKLLQKGNRSFLDAVIDPDAMNILLFTSGTTGLAKGVMLSHRNIVSNVMSMSKHVKVYNGDISLSVLPIHHTYEFTCNEMTVLYQGATIAFCEGLKHVVKNMNECHATIIVAVPELFEVMYKRIWRQAEKSGKADKLKKGLYLAKKLRRFNIKAMKKLFRDVHTAFGGNMRMFIAGAAPVDPEIVENFNLMGINTFQGYGMTECSPIIAVHKDRYHYGSAVGTALPGTEVFIADPDEDGIGEIVAKSDSVMLGYYENPEATAEVLKDGWLYTGDYGYLDEEGFLYVTGRKKNVIVTQNGKNIFPEEVEYYLMKSDFIMEVIVTGEQDQKNGNLVITANIVPDKSLLKEKFGKMNEKEMQDFFKEEVDQANRQMPPYKRVKRVVIRSEEFEKTSTRKIKRYGSNTTGSQAETSGDQPQQ